jgi:hypothetical protein
MMLSDASLDPRDLRLARLARMLAWGAWACIGLGLALLALAALLGPLQPITAALRDVLLVRDGGPADLALAAAGALLIGGGIGLLIASVGVLARELWAPFLLAAVALANIFLLISLGFTPALLALAFVAWASVGLWRERASFRRNPMALRELRGRMRGARAFLVITVYVGLMSAFALLLYAVYSTTSSVGSAAAGETGRVLFIGIFGIELLLILFIAPASTAGAISIEREHLTYDLLRATLLSAPSFVMGKLESALVFLFILLLAAVPLQSIAFLFGGVGEAEVMIAFALLAVTCIALGAVGIYFSAANDRSMTATVRAYGLIALLMFALPLGGTVAVNILNQLLFTPGAFTNLPFVETLLAYAGVIFTGLSPVSAALTTQELLVERQTAAFWSYTLSSSGGTIPMPSPWIVYTSVYLALAALLVLAAIRRTRQLREPA